MKEATLAAEYYTEVGAYYDQDAAMFETRYCVNETAQKIRNAFREETERFEFSDALEIGFGPGIDLIYFGKKYPSRRFYGIDVSKGMYDYAMARVSKVGLGNVILKLSSVETLQKDFEGRQFDLVYVFFGALNTVTDFKAAAENINQVLAPGGKIILTAINKWHLAGILLPLIKGRIRIAFKRLQKNWGGYSHDRFLNSKCYTPKDVEAAFPDFKIIRRQGYSIAFPAWYQDKLRSKLGRLYQALWKFDKLLNKTFLWSKGEYTLFVLERR
jgi:ubiquinone/menaquinone biosynthesis C-methylase UbiE